MIYALHIWTLGLSGPARGSGSSNLNCRVVLLEALGKNMQTGSGSCQKGALRRSFGMCLVSFQQGEPDKAAGVSAALRHPPQDAHDPPRSETTAFNFLSRWENSKLFGLLLGPYSEV